jgi:hypothetical protein
MKILTGLLFVLLLSSCGLYRTKTVLHKEPSIYTQHTTTSFPVNSKIDESKLSDFEIAVMNSWDEFTEEEKNFFRKSVINKGKIDSLTIKKN